ncbi:MAG: P22 coat - protein 5 family protein [Phycisphaerales bacterium]|nr:P22 coat - protein 5 family protein [Phycisphaerales bacterium]
MANTLTNLIPDIYAALDVVSLELVGFVPAVTLDPQAARGAIGQTLRSAVTPAAEASDIVPGVTPPDDGDQVIGNQALTITKSRRVPVRWNGEQTLGINSGLGYLTVRQQQFAQAMRRLINELEADLAALYVRASRAYGTAGLTPFATAGDYSDSAAVRQILVDNGAPISDLQLVINSRAGTSLRAKQAQAQMAGDTSLLRQGVLFDLSGFAVRESAQIRGHVKGTAAAYVVNNGAGYAVGDTVIAVDGGAGTLLAGDVITFAGDPHQYVVGTALAGGSLTLSAPGLRQALVDGTAVTLVNGYAANMAFSRSAIVAGVRLPALPEEGDMADDRMTITDARSGIALEVSLYRQYRQIQYEISLAWGVACVKPEHLAILMG